MSAPTTPSPSNRSALKRRGTCRIAPSTSVFNVPVPPDRVVVYYKGERMGEARLLDPIANDRKPLNPPSTEI